jgi:hypothetical protein
MSKSLIAKAHEDLDQLNSTMTHVLDVGDIPDGSDLDRKVQAALETLYTALHDVKGTRHASLLEKGPLIFPVKGRDMRFWRMSDGRRASVLFQGRQASRLASASRVLPNPSMRRFRAMTASQYLKELENAVITDAAPARSPGYERVRILV